MSVIVNVVRKGAYLDSVALMRIAAAVKAMSGVEDCGLLLGTPANRRIMAEAGVLAADGERAGPGDIVIALRAVHDGAAQVAVAEAERLLDAPRARPDDGGAWAPRTLKTAVSMLPGANLALISVPGAFAAAEAMKAIRQGLNVMLFSDNVGIEDEVELKRAARAKGLLMMGPDCGTAIVGGVPLAFANVVARGDIGIVGASGTGIQEISCLVSNAGRGISHAIGTGGRDLKAAVGGSTSLAAIDLLDADPATRHIVIVSKPPDAAVANAIVERVARSAKPFTICFIGGGAMTLSANAHGARTLEDAAALALGGVAPAGAPALPTGSRRGHIRGLFAGGTLCAEAQVVCKAAGLDAASNAAIEGVAGMHETAGKHVLIDLGGDEFTQGRPHPMIEPAVRDAAMAAAFADPDCAVVLVDCVLGYGSHADPAGHLAKFLSVPRERSPAVVASVTGTEADPQRRSGQVAKLEAAGVRVAASNAAAARLAVAIATGRDG